MSSTGDRRRARHRQAQAREVVPVPTGGCEDRLVERRRAGQHRDPLGSDARSSAGIEHRLREQVAPIIRHASHPALYPNVWKNGLTIRYRSLPSSPTTSLQARKTRRLWACVQATPLGCPVVPEVKRMSEKSPARTARARAAASAGVTAAPPFWNMAQSSVPAECGAVGDDDALQRRRRQVAAAQHGHVVEPEEAVDGHQRADAGADAALRRPRALSSGC